MASSDLSAPTAAAIAHALRPLHTPNLAWAAQFLLSQTAASALTPLTSSFSLKNAASLTAAVSATGPIPTPVSADILLIPALSIGSLSIGVAVMRDESGTLGASHTLAKFLISVDTGETLLMGYLTPEASDPADSVMTTLAAASSTSSCTVPPAAALAPRGSMRIMWWCPQRAGQRLSAVLDRRCIEEERYKNAIYVSSYTPSAVRRACVSCAERPGVEVCGCPIPEPQPAESPFDFLKHVGNMEKLGGLFVGNTTVCVRSENGGLTCKEKVSGVNLRFRRATTEDNVRGIAEIAIAGLTGVSASGIRVNAKYDLVGVAGLANTSGDTLARLEASINVQKGSIAEGAGSAAGRDDIRNEGAATLHGSNNEIDWDTEGPLGLPDVFPAFDDYLDEPDLSLPIQPMQGDEFLMAGGMSMVAAPSISGSASPVADLDSSGDWPASSSDMAAAVPDAKTLEAINASRIARAERRREKNREAARVSNARRKHRNDSLKAAVRDARLTVHRLRSRYLALSAENAALRAQHFRQQSHRHPGPP